MTQLILKGLRSVTVEAVEFKQPLGSRGTSAKSVPTMWEARLKNLDQTRPDYVSRNKDPDAALAGAAELFAKQKDLKRPVDEPELDDEAEALI